MKIVLRIVLGMVNVIKENVIVILIGMETSANSKTVLVIVQAMENVLKVFVTVTKDSKEIHVQIQK
jgi:hypothetical protein